MSFRIKVLKERNPSARSGRSDNERSISVLGRSRPGSEAPIMSDSAPRSGATMPTR